MNLNELARKAEQALIYLAETDEKFVYSTAHALQAEKKAKAVHAAIVLTTEGTGPVKQATAESSEDYADSLQNYFEAVRQRDYIRNKRQTAVTIIEVWRSAQSAANKGNVI